MSTSCGLILAANDSKASTKSIQILFSRRAVFDGQIHRRAQTSPAAGFVFIAGAGIERPAVDRKNAHLRIFPKNGLSSVAVVNVPIHDQHAFDVQFLDGDFGGDRHIVVDAKAHRMREHGMVSRRTNEAQGLLVFAAHEPFGGIANAAGGQSGDFFAGRADGRFLLDFPAARFRQRHDGIDIRRRMDARQSPSRNRLPLGPFASIGQPSSLKTMRNGPQTIRPFDFRSGLVL